MLQFSGLQPLIDQSPRRKYRRGVLLIQEGDAGHSVFVVLGGSVRSYSANWHDKEYTYDILGPGSLFGEMSLDGGPRSASVITLETTECAVIEQDSLKNYLLAHPQYCLEFLSLVISRARKATAAARSMALLDVYGRLRQLLSAASVSAAGAERVIEHRLTQKAIAHRVGASREMISRLLTDLEKGGYIAIRGDALFITKELPERW